MSENFVTLEHRYCDLFDKKDQIFRSIANLYSDWELPEPIASDEQIEIQDRAENIFLAIENGDIELNWRSLAYINKLVLELDQVYCDLQDNQVEALGEIEKSKRHFSFETLSFLLI